MPQERASNKIDGSQSGPQGSSSEGGTCKVAVLEATLKGSSGKSLILAPIYLLSLILCRRAKDAFGEEIVDRNVMTIKGSGIIIGLEQ